MAKELLTPDYIFESSWEVCNKVGGIYTVLSTRAKTLQDVHKDKLFFIGPDFWLGKENPLFVENENSLTEELVNLDICRLLKQELKVPFLFLSGGQYSYLHRTIGPALGVCMWLCFREYDETTYAGPPLLANVLKIKEGLKL